MWLSYTKSFIAFDNSTCSMNMHFILLTCRVHMYHTLNHSLSLPATHKIVSVFPLALYRHLVRMQGLKDTVPFVHFIQVSISRYRLWYSYPFDFRNRALSHVNLVLWACSREVSDSSVVRAGNWKARVLDWRWRVGVCSFPRDTWTMHFEKHVCCYQPSHPFLLMLDVF